MIFLHCSTNTIKRKETQKHGALICCNTSTTVDYFLITRQHSILNAHNLHLGAHEHKPTDEAQGAAGEDDFPKAEDVVAPKRNPHHPKAPKDGGNAVDERGSGAGVTLLLVKEKAGAKWSGQGPQEAKRCEGEPEQERRELAQENQGKPTHGIDGKTGIGQTHLIHIGTELHVRHRA